jgi:hypothetical protein
MSTKNKVREVEVKPGNDVDFFSGAEGRNRTDTSLRIHDFETCQGGFAQLSKIKHFQI